MLKRLFDMVASAAGLAATLPFYPFIALAIKLDSPGPVFYRQVRVGLNGRPFRIWKFRTMVTEAERAGLLSNQGDPRITRVGRWLRRFEIDEMPTLINVLVGDMSIVGPRPEVPRYVELYTPEQRRVLSVRPGMTDLGTLRFRNETALMDSASSPEQVYLEQILPHKLSLNLEYVQRQSLFFDLYVIFATLFLILRQKKG
jgi:lipopolysaccharide/colanic/teichoic acid biosynthesis glycosyltransferase